MMPPVAEHSTDSLTGAPFQRWHGNCNLIMDFNTKRKVTMGNVSRYKNRLHRTNENEIMENNTTVNQ
jgi:hypothetical protein